MGWRVGDADQVGKKSTQHAAFSPNRAVYLTHLSIRARDYHEITVRIAEPNFSVLGCRVKVRL
jgi:hypothetical protein